MDDDSEPEEVMDYVDPDDSDFLLSGEEYVPDSSSCSENELETERSPPPIKKRKISNVKNKTSVVDSSSDDEDEIPLACLISKLHKRKENRTEAESEEFTKVFDVPMWTSLDEVPFEKVNSDFLGNHEPPPDELKTPYQYFTDLITDDMIEMTTFETNRYALSKHGIELKTTKKEIEIFIGLYLRMGIMRANCIRAYWSPNS